MRHVITTLVILGCMAPFVSQHSAAKAAPSCSQIDKAISANEDFAEFALADDQAAAKDALAAIHRTFERIKPSLSADAAAEAESQIKAAETAFEAGDLPNAALAAIEVYRVLITGVMQRLPTSLDVAMLDYTGFRFQALTAASPSDWSAIAGNAAVSARNTEKAQKHLAGKRVLSDLIGDIQAGIAGATAAKDTAWLRSAAQIQLDTVDLLEQVIKNPLPSSCG